MREPEVALAFTPDPWVEELHRHLSDHGGARVRAVVVEPGVALEESYDVLVAGHRWPALTRALVADVRSRGRAVLGVCDREEAASRAHLAALGVDAIVDSDAGADGFVRAIASAATGARAETPTRTPAPRADVRAGRLVTVGGPPGAGRTEVAIELAAALTRHASTALIDADDVAPAVAQRLGLALEPNLRTAIDAVEHGRGALDACVHMEPRRRLVVVGGVPNAHGWAQVRPGEVLRVVAGLAARFELVVADGAGSLDDLPGAGGRGRFATARALVADADALVAVCDASPHGVTRLLAWVVDARALAPDVPFVVVVNRAHRSRFRRGELWDEIRTSAAVVDVAFASYDPRVVAAAWDGAPVAGGPFTKAIADVARAVAAFPRRPSAPATLEVAS
jgi:CO dehydrogenase nickel-insertion accessory protein CooC1